MENKMGTQFKDWLNEQLWWQQLRGKWDELDPQARQSIQWGSIILLVVCSIGLVTTASFKVRTLKRELTEKTELVQLLQTATEEIRRLRESQPPGATAAAPDGNWRSYLEGLAEQAGVPKESLSFNGEQAGKVTDAAKETQMDLVMKQVNIKHVVKMAFHIENGARPMKLRALTVDTKGDPAGYLEANLSISGFGLK